MAERKETENEIRYLRRRRDSLEVERDEIIKSVHSLMEGRGNRLVSKLDMMKKENIEYELEDLGEDITQLRKANERDAKLLKNKVKMIGKEIQKIGKKIEKLTYKLAKPV